MQNTVFGNVMSFIEVNGTNMIKEKSLKGCYRSPFLPLKDKKLMVLNEWLMLA